MGEARLLIGDVFERMAELEDGSVDLVLTSPPFLALRSYLPADHPDKAKEIGSEPTPAAFIDTLLALTAEWRRVLAPHGSIAVELGDTYSGSGAGGGDYTLDGTREGPGLTNRGAKREALGIEVPERRDTSHGWPLAKSLCLIPELYRIGLVYGMNPLTGQPSPAGQWRARNVVRWCRPNPPVGALGDKFRPATSEMVVACVSSSRYFDLDAVRTEHKPHSQKYGDAETRARHGHEGYVVPERGDGGRMTYGLNAGGAPPLDWWEIPTAPYAGSHYATWPPALCEKPIKAMVPHKVCTVCGEPSRRIVGEAEYLNDDGTERAVLDEEWRHGRVGLKGDHLQKAGHLTRSAPTLGWSSCGHDAWRTGIVLDPFSGSGTTLAVATGHGRDAIGIDLDPRNADLAVERCGMFLEVDYGRGVEQTAVHFDGCACPDCLGFCPRCDAGAAGALCTCAPCAVEATDG